MGCLKSRLKEASLEEKLVLSPWQKWKRYKLFPMKFVLNIVITALVCAEIILPTLYINPRIRANIDSFDEAFLPKEKDEDDIARKRRYFVNQHEFLDSLSQMADAFATWDEDSLTRSKSVEKGLSDYTYYRHYDGKQGSQIQNRATLTTRYNITAEEPYGPFAIKDAFERAIIIRKMKTYTVTFGFMSYSVTSRGKIDNDAWILSFTYSFTSRGYIMLTREYTRRPMSVTDYNWVIVIICIVQIVLCVWESILFLRSIFTAIDIMRETRRSYNELLENGVVNVPWKALPFKSRFKFFDAWYVAHIVSSALVIIGCVFDILTQFNIVAPSTLVKLIISIGALTQVTCLIHWFKWSEKYYMLIYSLMVGSPIIIRFFIGCVPLYLGYSLLVFSLYGEHTERFESLSHTMINLYAMMHGDELMDANRNMYGYNDEITSVLVTFFSFFFNLICLNIFVSIIEESYHMSKRRVSQNRAMQQQILDPQKNQDNDVDNVLPSPSPTLTPISSQNLPSSPSPLPSLQSTPQASFSWGQMEPKDLALIIHDLTVSEDEQEVKSTLKKNVEKVVKEQTEQEKQEWVSPYKQEIEEEKVAMIRMVQDYLQKWEDELKETVRSHGKPHKSKPKK
ncbi:putative G-protein-coupled receptor family protein [Blattamonas nauphoetae]|uniref:G-protein-coupled receptor family protein n=1 Tax=Blattamonas nauphoetae TaxID=2049346 RepID=A0ABQ9XLB0_9EUKA|nr:putative G-protein-coupled receptor family protein [Blattamonas nauphoetae]